MIKTIMHIKEFALQDNSALTVKQLSEAIARMCDDAISEAVEQTLALDAAKYAPKCTTERLCPVHNVWHAAPPRK